MVCQWRNVLAIICLVLAAAGCATVSVEDFPKQEFLVKDKPLIHLALRGLRQGKKVVCEVYLLTAGESMWISGAEIQLANGSIVDPKQIISIEEREIDRSYVYEPYTWSYWYRRPSGYPRGWYCSTRMRYRDPSGVEIPAWSLLRRPTPSASPLSFELTYELPGVESSLKGGQFLVRIGIEAAKDSTKANTPPGEKSKDAKATTPARQGETVPFVFSMTEQVPYPQTKTDQEEAEKIVYEVRFAPKG